MENTDMTKEQLLDELKKMKHRVAELETKLSNNHEFESLSVFASGIAHEYNNLLTAIIGNLSLAKMYAKPGYEVYDVLAEAEKASIRAKDLTLQLLTFADGKKPVKKASFSGKTPEGLDQQRPDRLTNNTGTFYRGKSQCCRSR